MPEALISRITSRGPGVGSGNSLSSSFRSPRNTTPFMAPVHYPTLSPRSEEDRHELGYPALEKGGQAKKLIGYFQADTGMINQLVHLWKFDDDADRRAHWASVFANKDFVEGFAAKFRPLVASQEVKLLTAAPWGPHP